MSDKSKSSFLGDFKTRLTKEEKPVKKPVRRDSSSSDSEEETVSESPIRQNFHPKVEECLNKQINLEFEASYTFRSMWIYFDRHQVALPGFSKFYFDAAEEEKEHAMKLMEYVNQRGGIVTLEDIDKPAADNWGTPLGSIQTAVGIEKKLNDTLLDLHKLSLKHADPLTEKFVRLLLDKHVHIIKMQGDHLTNLQRVGTGLGEYLFEQKTLNGEDVECGHQEG